MRYYTSVCSLAITDLVVGEPSVLLAPSSPTTLSSHFTVGGRAFPVAGHQVWNGLLLEVTSVPSMETFRRYLNAHLFTQSYLDIQLI